MISSRKKNETEEGITNLQTELETTGNEVKQIQQKE